MTADFTTTKTTPDLAFVSQHLFTAILWVDDKLTITRLNAQAEQLLAISSGRLINQSILMLLAPEELKSQDTAALDSTNLDPTNNNQPIDDSDDNHLSEVTYSLTERFAQAQNYQQPFIDHDHIIKTSLNGNLHLSVDYSVTPVLYEQQSYFIIEMWGKDRQSRISEEQRQQQQYTVARHMLRSVAHEIKNPLAGIRGAAQLLQRQFIKFSDATTANMVEIPNTVIDTSDDLQKMNQKLRNYTDIIISETDRLTHLIGQLLGSNQLPNWQTINVHEPLEHVLTLIVNQYPQVLLQRDYDLSLPELCADKDQLIQVFLNLINNACESMTEFEQTLQQDNLSDTQSVTTQETSASKQTEASESYQPTLHIQTRVAFQHTIVGQQHKQVMQITITDNGSGIDPALIGQIFFPMVTSRAAGTGLGLSIVQDIISHHHGMIDVSSTEGTNGKQTRFTLYLPFHQPTHDP